VYRRVFDRCYTLECFDAALGGRKFNDDRRAGLGSIVLGPNGPSVGIDDAATDRKPEA
jgi:hypothetical protein